jgi:transposase InsO family protein
MAEASAAAEQAGIEYASPLADRIGEIRRTILKNAREEGWAIDESQLDDRHIVRRMVLKRCVYGVDKNPMAVELAKVALWLHTFTVGAPLSFIDHHLRCGDSLFGLWVREGFDIARCTVKRLMRDLSLQGVIGGKPVKTTISDKAAPCPLDQVNRQFHAPAPNMLWVSDFTYVATWAGFVYVAFVIDVDARYIVGWRVSRTAHASFVLDALEQAIHDRRPVHRGGLIHHSDRGSQYVSIKYAERLAEAGIEPSVGSIGDSYNNALAETINGLYKAEVIHRRGPWRSFEAVEYATLEWVDWFNNRRLLEPIGNIPPAEAEERYYAMLDDTPMAA